MSDDMIGPGDLVVTADGYYALVKAALPPARLLVRLANGLVTVVDRATVTPLGFGPACGPDGGRAVASFHEEMRPDWADPYSRRYRPPLPDTDPFHRDLRPVLNGTYACPECLEDIVVDAGGRPVEAVPSNGGALWYHTECMQFNCVSHQVGLCDCFGPRPAGETRRQTARLCWERYRARSGLPGTAPPTPGFEGGADS